MMAAAIAGKSDWSATCVQDCLSADLNPVGGQSALSRRVRLTYPDQDEAVYHVDFNSGMVQYGTSATHDIWPEGYDDKLPGIAPPSYPIGFQNVLVEYRAGYDTLPDDLVRVANQLVAEAYRLGTHDTALASENLGGYTYSLVAGVQRDEATFSMLSPFMELR
jgi:hypothetical protein